MNNNLLLISLHIAKTGGKSFFNILSDIYGAENVIRFRKVKYEVENNDYSKYLNEAAQKYNVLHGHFLYREVENIHKNSDAKVITWFRNPVERVISRYFYLQKRIEEDENHIQKDKQQMTLIEYASLPSQRNVMCQYIEGINVEGLFFAGVLEYYTQSIEEFKQLLNINQKVKIHWDNNNVIYKSKYNVSEEDRGRIAELNLDDIELYKNVLKIKGIV